MIFDLRNSLGVSLFVKAVGLSAVALAKAEDPQIGIRKSKFKNPFP